jgi:hypothetical protein
MNSHNEEIGISDLQVTQLDIIKRMIDGYYQQWQGTKIIKNTENVNGVWLKMPTSPGLTSLMGCRFIT